MKQEAPHDYMHILAAGLALVLSGLTLAGVARVTVEITDPAPPAEGAATYEVVSGTFDGKLDPASPQNRFLANVAMGSLGAK